jgi:hypothetical protein
MRTTFRKKTPKSVPPSTGKATRNWKCTRTPAASSPSTKPSAPPTPSPKPPPRHKLANQFKDAKAPFKIVIVRDIYRSGLEFFFKRKPELEMSGCSKPFYSGDCFFKNKTG